MMAAGRSVEWGAAATAGEGAWSAGCMGLTGAGRG